MVALPRARCPRAPKRPACGPNFARGSRSENLRLAKIWDARGLLALFHEEPPHKCRVFNAYKSSLVDRQIGDRRWGNQHEFHPRGPSALLPSGSSICSLHCGVGHTLRGCVSDRKDLYHQCAATRSRAFTNCLPFRFDKEDFLGSGALDDLVKDISRPTKREVHGDRLGMPKRRAIKEKDIAHVYAGFQSLFHAG